MPPTLTSEKPTILLIQGSFQTPLFYASLHTYLHSLGYPTTHPLLPSLSPNPIPTAPTITLTDDAQAVENALTHLINVEQETVIVAMHSYGGLVGSTCIPPELTLSHRKTEGKQGGVAHLFYFCTFILPIGQSVLSAFGESPNNHVHADGTFSLKNAKEVLLKDLQEEEAEVWAGRLVRQRYAVQETKMEGAAYEYVDCTYLICEGDRACPKEFQEMFAERAGARVLRCKAGHEPMISWTEGLGDVIMGVVEKVVGEPMLVVEMDRRKVKDKFKLGGYIVTLINQSARSAVSSMMKISRPWKF